MNEDELIKTMLNKKFSKKQIKNLKKISEKYATPLYDTIFELSRRFPRSLLIHVLTFFLIFHSYIQLSEKHGHTIGRILLSIGILCIIYLILDLFAPLSQGYKARKVIKEINKKDHD